MNSRKSFKFNERARLFNGWITCVDSETLMFAFHLYLRVFKLKNSKFDELEADSKKLVLTYQNLNLNDLVYFLCRLTIHFCADSSYGREACRDFYTKWVREQFGLICKEEYLVDLIDLFDCEDF